ncbi:MAG: hypothetical protein ACRDT0_21030 [Pseudonocardiaceae bacterium]
MGSIVPLPYHRGELSLPVASLVIASPRAVSMLVSVEVSVAR